MTSQSLSDNPSASNAVPRPSKTGAWLQVAAGLLWIVQAGLIAWSIDALQRRADWQGVLWAAALFLVVGVVRAGVDAAGLRRAFIAARRSTQQLR